MMDFGRYGGYGRGMFGFGGLFVGLLCLIFFVAVILWIVRMVTWRRHGMGCGMHGMHGMYGMYDDYGPMHGMQDEALVILCLLYTSDAADDLLCVDLGGRRIIKKKKSTTLHHL